MRCTVDEILPGSNLDDDLLSLLRKQMFKPPPMAEDAANSNLLPLVWACDAGALVNSSYVVKNVAGPGELIAIHGAPKSGKTFFTTDMGLRVAAGMPWFGHRVKPGLVMRRRNGSPRRASGPGMD